MILQKRKTSNLLPNQAMENRYPLKKKKRGKNLFIIGLAVITFFLMSLLLLRVRRKTPTRQLAPSRIPSPIPTNKISPLEKKWQQLKTNFENIPQKSQEINFPLLHWREFD